MMLVWCASTATTSRSVSLKRRRARRPPNGSSWLVQKRIWVRCRQIDGGNRFRLAPALACGRTISPTLSPCSSGGNENMLLPAQIIQKKRDGKALTEEEIRFFIDGFTSGELPEYQIAALAMAICFQGMNFDETMWLTRAMVESGKVVHWRHGAHSAPQAGTLAPPAPSNSEPPSPFYADKHSTGGIGDKTSLI